MEEWLDFLQTFSPHVLHNLPWGDSPQEVKVRKIFEHMWGLLRPAVLYFMRFFEGQHTEEQIMKAQQMLLDYGAYAQEVGADQFSTRLLGNVHTQA